VNYTFRMLLRSLFMVHNETGNVWTHLLGFLLVVAIAHHIGTTVVVSTAPLTDRLLFTGYVFTALWCLGASSVYHLLHPHSPGVHRTTLFCDFFGISLLVTGSFIPAIYFTFACFPFWCSFYLTVSGVLCGATLVLPWFSFFHTWHLRRIGVYFFTVASGIVPAVHAMLLLPLNPVTWPVYTGVAWMMLFYAVGVVFYAARIPERWYPGHFDLWFNSHQIWHGFVLAATVVHLFSCIGTYQRYEALHC
jgi:adiponectin receptor